MKKIGNCFGLHFSKWFSPKLLVSLVLFFIGLNLMAQGKRIDGTIVDSKNEPLIGVNVVVKDKPGVGTISGADGSFSIVVDNPNAVLIFSFLGMETQSISVKDKTQLKIVMAEDSKIFTEVVVVGYGQQKKESVVGSITQTTGKVLERSGGVSNLGSALTGQLPGVITYSSSGQPGEENPQIIIRTQTSWNNSSPLILVDGIERGINDVDISSVESVSVLKDASATAVYGVRGANGVILINTKRGKEGKASIQVRANTTFKFPSKLPEKYDAYDALLLRNQAIEREMALTDSWSSYTPLAIIDKYRNPANTAEAERYPNVNWKDVLFKDYARAYNASANVAGGTEFVKYFAAVDFVSEGDIFKTVDNGQGYQPGFSYNRINVRSNLDFQLTKTTKFSSNLFGSNGAKQTPWNFDVNGVNPWTAAYYTAPDAFLPVYSNGVWGYYQPHDAAQPNSVYIMARSGIEKQTQTKITTDFTLKQDLGFVTKGLTFEASYSNDNTFNEVDRGVNDSSFKSAQRMWVDPTTGVIIYDLPLNASTQFDYVDQVTWTVQAGSVDPGVTFRKQYYSTRLNYDRTFGKHSVTALGLFSREKSAFGSEFAKFREDWVFRGTYNFDGKYFLEFNGAYNGSEKFGPENRFAFFPSLSGGWMLSDESFMKSISVLDMLKIRGSWGRIGDDAVGGRWLYADQWSYGGSAYLGALSGNSSPYVFYRNTKIGNPNIAWETVEKRNIGVDYSFFKGLIAGSVDYFNDHRSEILISGGRRAVASYFGATVPTGNLGEVKSTGYEVEVRLSKNLNPDLRLWANMNMTHAVNKVKFADDPTLYPDYQKTAGYAIGQTKAYIDAGYLSTWDDVLGSTTRQINNANKLAGDYNIVDFNGDGIIDTYDKAPYGYTGVPQNTFSSTIGFDWKGVNFSMQFYGVSNVTREVLFPTFYETKNNVYAEGSYWTIADGGDVPLPRWKATKGEDANGTRYLYDASYVRLKTAELGYTFKDGWIKRVGMRTCKFYVSGNNLFLWTKLPDDRESNFGGDSRGGAYPTMRRVTLGLDLTF